MLTVHIFLFHIPFKVEQLYFIPKHMYEATPKHSLNLSKIVIFVL